MFFSIVWLPLSQVQNVEIRQHRSSFSMEPLQVPTALGTPPSTETTPTSSRITTTMGTMAHNVIEDIYGAFPPSPHVSLELPHETNNAEQESRNELG